MFFWELPLLEALHLIAAVVWIGGMFFAYACLRPATGELAPSLRLTLWRGVLQRFLAVVWLAVIALPATGYRLAWLDFGGLMGAPRYVQFMHGAGWLMIALFVYLWFGPRRRLINAAARHDAEAGGAALSRVRLVVLVNLTLGLAILLAVTVGGFFAV